MPLVLIDNLMKDWNTNYVCVTVTKLSDRNKREELYLCPRFPIVVVHHSREHGEVTQYF